MQECKKWTGTLTPELASASAGRLRTANSDWTLAWLCRSSQHSPLLLRSPMTGTPGWTGPHRHRKCPFHVLAETSARCGLPSHLCMRPYAEAHKR
eukprot:1298994-Amphidinium_carterae.1